MEISRKLSKQPFSTGSGRITQRNNNTKKLVSKNPRSLGCWFLNVLVLISGFLLWSAQSIDDCG